ncbi:unnamed protein product [Brassicogethes aeneus]|uniref:Protein-tyrosine-phosphatase n=1 Tax=Brassicogethes aeneus TaxID=1431903 RepID=A0A9P0B770_BRAAE|nr:unnamed protein product [Brassicogethes aeneus]
MSGFLHREDFSLGPISIDWIEHGLYLGSLAAAKHIPTLVKYKITHILTIDTVPLPRNILELPGVTVKFIQLADQPKEDLLSYFEDTYNFIDEGIKEGHVFVHCYFGVSRSATVVLAYYMKKYKLGFAEALEKVKKRRSIVHPNYGFVAQLKLYHQMGYNIDKNNPQFKMFRLGNAADTVRKVKVLPPNFFDLIKPDPGRTQTEPNPNVYRCKKCRRVVASENNLLTHKNKGKICTKTYFIEPIAWMNVTHSVQGKLCCPKCQAKLGSYSWIMGCQCPCGVKVAPAFYLTPSKVDFSNVVKNVEMTF